MSDYDKHIGKISKLNCDNFEEYAKKYLEDNNIEFESKYYDTYTEQVMDLYPPKFVKYSDNEYWIIKEDKEIDDYNFDYALVDKVGENEYKFDVLYWNGGMCLTDKLIECINKIKIMENEK